MRRDTMEDVMMLGMIMIFFTVTTWLLYFLARL
jgi:hypothetical protein